MKRNVRKCRCAWQRARRNDRTSVNERENEYKHALNEYKKEIRKAKEEYWKRFVRESGNRDPWGDVYKVCMGKYDRERISGMKVGDRLTNTWRESVEVLMTKFFPAARMNVIRNGMNEQSKVRKFEWQEVHEAI